MKALCLLPALIHIYIFILESFRWQHPRTRKVFAMSESQAEQTKLMAFNQGFYNLFLALGVIGAYALSFSVDYTQASLALGIFSNLSIIGAGLVLLASGRHLWRGALIQIVPALLSLALFVFAG